MSFLSGVVGGIGDVVGALIGQKENNKDRNQQDQTNQLNYDMQKEFAKNSIRWKVEDAMAAGIHPLAALGASGYSASPSYVNPGVDRSMSQLSRDMGQNISRAVQSTMTSNERAMTRIAQDRGLLENDLLRIQIRNEMAKNPSVPDVIEKPLERVAHDQGNPWQEVGSYPSVTYMQSPTGLVPIMPPNLAEALESDQSNQAQWAIRYKGGPNVFPTERPSNKKLRHFGSDKIGFVWSRKFQEWQPKSRRELENMGRQAAENKWFRSRKKSTNENYWNTLP